jgi:uncharacterized protein
VKCNIQCQYCYQNPQRDAGNVSHDYDLEKMKAAVERDGGPFTLFGGEALMVPERDLEELWSWGFQKWGGTGIQTNGTLITENHIRMCKAYRVHVGISVDGPGELNDIRWAGTLERTREATARTHQAIARLCQEGMPPSLIVTLHRGNATADKLPIMHEWLRELERLGVTSTRLHILEVESGEIRDKYALSAEENLAAFLSFLRLESELTTLKFDVFKDMRNLLLGKDHGATCVWNACDPFTTRAVQGVEGQGQRSNCGRTNKEGIDFIKSSDEGFERYLALYHTPQQHGGCAGCRFFLMCKGQCPGTAIDGDWRNRTEHCETWKGLFRHLEERMLDENQFPISVSPARKEIEEAFLAAWAGGRNMTMTAALTPKEESASAPVGSPNRHASAVQSDSPHGDSGHRASSKPRVRSSRPAGHTGDGAVSAFRVEAR